jgi:putative acetyltransferase
MRAYRPQDFAAIADFWVEAWVATGIAEDFAARRPWLQAHLDRLMAGGATILVACDERDAPVGFATIDAAGSLDQLCVAPAAQGRGVARALLEAAKARAPGRVELHVNAENPRARALYESAGFVVAGEAVSCLSGRPTLRMEWRNSEIP